jgi:hypothetical protein
MANTFSQDKNKIISIVNSNKKYKQQAYIQLINSDYIKSNSDLQLNAESVNNS